MKACLTAAWLTVILLASLSATSLSAIFAQSRTSTSPAAAPATNEHAALSRAAPCFGVREPQPEKQLEDNAIVMLPDWDRRWLTEDVADLISHEERCAFLHLATGEERTQFIEEFWARRASDRTSLDNTFKRKHYERIAFADENFGTQIPGWKTDRGRIYVQFGPPDSFESHRADETIAGALAEGVEAHSYPWEVWHYNQLRGRDTNLEFVDPSATGDYRLVMPPELQDELTFAPAHDVGGTVNGKVHAGALPRTDFRIVIEPAPIMHFKDLEAVATSNLERDQVRFTHRIEFFRATDATTLARLVVRVPILVEEEGGPTPSSNAGASSPVTLEVFGRISTPSRVIETFEDRISFDGQRNSAQAQPYSQFEAALSPGTYSLALVIKDVITGDVGTSRETIAIPSYENLSRAKTAN